jgi:hypothetical protein
MYYVIFSKCCLGRSYNPGLMAFFYLQLLPVTALTVNMAALVRYLDLAGIAYAQVATRELTVKVSK